MAPDDSSPCGVGHEAILMGKGCLAFRVKMGSLLLSFTLFLSASPALQDLAVGLLCALLL